MTRPNKLLYSFLFLLFLPGLALSLPDDRDKPITGKAEKTTIDANSGKTILTGNVVIRHGLLTIFADQVTIENEETTNKTKYIVATGNPVQFTDTPTLDKPPVEVTGQQIEFFVLDDLIITLGNARIVNGGNEALGERIQYNTVTGLMTIEGECALNNSDNCQQAEFILQPGAEN